MFVGVTWTCFLRCVEGVLRTSITNEAKVCLMPLVDAESIVIVCDFLALVDQHEVGTSCIHLLEPLVVLKERDFPSHIFKSSKLLVGNEPTWGEEFLRVSSAHHSRCNDFMNDFIDKSISCYQ